MLEPAASQETLFLLTSINLRWSNLRHEKSWCAVGGGSGADRLCERANVRMGQHVAASDYSGLLHRIIVINNLDKAFDDRLPDTFDHAITAALARCNVVATVYSPDLMELDAGPKLKSRLEAFKPDGALLIRQTVRNQINGEVRGGTYLVTARDETQHRDIWKATIGTGASTRWMADRSVTRPKLADLVVRQMSTDGVLKSCPPFQPE